MASTCIYSVDSGVGRLSTVIITPAPPGDGTVAEIPFGWVPGDPPYDVVYVTDLPVSEPTLGDIIESRFARVDTSSAPVPNYGGVAFNQISLSSPTQLGKPTRHLRWRVRMSSTLPDPFTSYHATWMTHPWTFEIGTHYNYEQTSADVAVGWTDESEDILQYCQWGGGVDNTGWLVTMLGDGAATFGLIGTDHLPVVSFIPTTDWYIIELLSSAGRTHARMYLDGGTVPDWQLSDTGSVVTSNPGISYLNMQANLFVASPFFVEYDWIQIWSKPVGTILPPQPDGRVCEFPATIDGHQYSTASDFLPSTLEVWLNGIRQRPGVDYIEHPADVTGSPDDRDHYFTFTPADPTGLSDAVYCCYVALVH